jgi:hypothetical protein
MAATPAPAAAKIADPTLALAATAMSAVSTATDDKAPAIGGDAEAAGGGAKRTSGGDAAFDVEQTFAALLSDSIVPPPASEPGGESMRPVSGKNLAPPTSAPPEPSPLEAALRGLPTRTVTGASGKVPPVEPRLVDKGPRTSPSGTLIVTPAGLVAGDGLKEATRKEASPPIDKASLPSEPVEERAPETPAIDLATAIVTNASETPEPPKNEPTRPSSVPQPKAPPASSRHATLRGVPSVVPVPGARPAESGEMGSPVTPSPPRATPEPAKGADRFVRGAVVLVLAAGVGYGAMTAVRSRLEVNMAPPVVPSSRAPVQKVVPVAPEATTMQPAAPSAPPAASASPVQSVPGVWPVQDLELPSDIVVAPDRGLLEIDVAAPHSIYVDGVFIGRGPTRRIPLREGPHELRVRGDGVDAVQSIDVRKARRVRFGTTNSQ